jgi:hypothetical protein
MLENLPHSSLTLPLVMYLGSAQFPLTSHVHVPLDMLPTLAMSTFPPLTSRPPFLYLAIFQLLVFVRPVLGHSRDGGRPSSPRGVNSHCKYVHHTRDYSE